MTSAGDTDMVRAALTNPSKMAALRLSEWDLLIRQARAAGVLGRIHSVMDKAGLINEVPSQPRHYLESAQRLALSQARLIRWETHCLEKVLEKVGTDVVLLKGAAYVLMELPIAEGRLQSDVDIMVPKSKLSLVEELLTRNGWQSMKLDPYDQRFYRQWSHELPPLYHEERETVLDVHHNILPETGRLKPDPDKLIESAVPIPGTLFKRLCPEDMLLHVSAHMFQDGSLTQGLRELADIDGLIRFFGSVPEFWIRLPGRAFDLDLDRPLFYALRYTQLFLDTPIPEHVTSAARSWGPSHAVLRTMDKLVSNGLRHDHTSTRSFSTSACRKLLYMRSHWLRFPPLLLMRHLTHQSVRRMLTRPET